VLTTLGLSDAINGIATRSLVPITIREMPARRLHPLIEATAYFVLIEAIANAQKHARASAIELRVELRGPTVYIEIRDDGVGGAQVAAGSGLEGLCDRVDAAGGTIDIASMPSRGTRIAAIVPAQPRTL
jgi:signal transduction histidine kinase